MGGKKDKDKDWAELTKAKRGTLHAIAGPRGGPPAKQIGNQAKQTSVNSTCQIHYERDQPNTSVTSTSVRVQSGPELRHYERDQPSTSVTSTGVSVQSISEVRHYERDQPTMSVTSTSVTVEAIPERQLGAGDE